MIEKQIALNILEDIQDSLMKENWKEEPLKTIDIYIEKGQKQPLILKLKI